MEEKVLLMYYTYYKNDVNKLRKHIKEIHPDIKAVVKCNKNSSPNEYKLYIDRSKITDEEVWKIIRNLNLESICSLPSIHRSTLTSFPQTQTHFIYKIF